MIFVAFRTEERLLECIQSVLREPGANYEIIVVDNGGNARVHGALSRLPALHVSCPQNLILSAERNVGAPLRKSPYMVIRHDFGDAGDKLDVKMKRHGLMKHYLRRKNRRIRRCAKALARTVSRDEVHLKWRHEFV